MQCYFEVRLIVAGYQKFLILHWQKLNEDVLAWYLKTSKLALALAVISDTPPEKSSREYAEHLAKTLSVKEVDWKVKAETWKTEVLRLRQELFLSRMKSIAGTSNGADSAFCPEFPTRGALESRNESTHLEDSGCDLSNGQESDTQDLLANHSLGYLDSYSLTSEKSKALVSSTLLHPESNSTRRDKLEEGEKMLNLQTEFLQSLIRIRKIAMVRMPSTEALILDSDHSVVTDSVSLLAKNLLAFCVESRSLLPDSLLMETTWTLVHLLHGGKLPKIILVQCIKIVEELVKDLVKVILDNTKVNRFLKQELLADLLIVLGQCPSFSNQVFANLLSGINRFVDYLWQIRQTEFDESSYENVYYLFWILEQLLQHKNSAGCGVPTMNCLELEKLQQRLDKIVLHLSDDFPLFTMYLWRLGALLNVTSQQKNS
ncbi:meiosis-specific protein MEI4 [Chiloscyllium punctatum]|uniref:meiosis-specific protein MEI4 n=1 Tax=Chiloscyllium punctatum TaxID=137246 RepID=UPI003B6378F8